MTAFDRLADMHNYPKEAATFLALLGYTPNAIKHTLIQNGIPPDQARTIVAESFEVERDVTLAELEIITKDREAIDQERT